MLQTNRRIGKFIIVFPDYNHLVNEKKVLIVLIVLIVLLFSTPIIFFFANRVVQFVFGSNNQESLTAEIIGAVMCGYGASLAFWLLYKKVNKKESKLKFCHRLVNLDFFLIQI